MLGNKIKDRQSEAGGVTCKKAETSIVFFEVSFRFDSGEHSSISNKPGFKPLGRLMNKFILVNLIAHSMVAVLLNDDFFRCAGKSVNFFSMD